MPRREARLLVDFQSISKNQVPEKKGQWRKETASFPTWCSSTVFELSRVSCNLQRVLEASKAVEKMKVFVLDDVEFCLSDYTDYTTVPPIDHPRALFSRMTTAVQEDCENVCHKQQKMNSSDL